MAPPQPLEFPIQPKLGHSIGVFLCSQLFRTPAYPTNSFAGQTVIVTGSNAGLGLEAARHFYRLGAARLILAVRTVSKGQAAKEDIARSITSQTDADSIEVWPLDQSSTPSTLAFAERVRTGLPRVDVVVLNAGLNNPTFQLSDEGYEQTVQVNVLNTFLLALALLPKLNHTKANFSDSTPHLTVISSEAHRLTSFPEINAPDLYAKLNEERAYAQQPRYQVSKLLEVLLVRELVARLKLKSAAASESESNSNNKAPPVIINLVNPGLCNSTLGSSPDAKPPSLLVRLLRGVLDRTTEVGARTYVLAASALAGSHGEFQSDGLNQEVEAWIYTDVGRRVQRKVWEQTVRVLEARRPGILEGVGL
ncbi:retinol dehydrogenase 14 [Parachaetomium inaequale]|uniref:Retinol dehydrogenase 14 n=1 Tax=Parachaetomium inaequale TaxID=2588326 RepID=A0AAN6P967_9PEZI|nr:retinol dehydrogenase 14 [Parachaetomium inaequale]